MPTFLWRSSAMPNAPLSLSKGFLRAALLWSFVLAAFIGAAVRCAETGTFNTSSVVIGRLLARSDGAEQVRSLEAEFRTSHAIKSGLIGLKNAHMEELAVQVANDSQLTVRLTWLSDSKDETEYLAVEGEPVSDGEYSLATLHALDLTLNASGVGLGDWRRLVVYLDNGSLLLDDIQVGQLPANFSAQFAWNGTAEITAGGGFRGCLANFSLDGTVQVPLHSESELLFNGSISVNLSSSRLPGGGPGCRQVPCPCLPNGECIYARWDLVKECQCARGHLGSRCQSYNHCLDSITCQNGASCNLTGNADTGLDYLCTCSQGYTGRNCTAMVQPEAGLNTGLIVGITVGVIAILLLLIAALVAIKVIRDRRRDSGAYRPSRREGSASADRNTMGLDHIIRPPKEERLI